MVQAMVKRYPFLQLAGVFDQAAEALRFLQNNPVQVLFSDVEMEGMDGLELRRHAMDLPACIFITSYPEYAADSFALSALDYIVKPVSSERFAAAMKRLEDYMEIRRKATLFDYSLGGQNIFIKEGTQQVKVALHEVLYLEALRDYTRIVTALKKYCVLGSLHQMLEKEAFKSFVRIHRSYAVQQHFVQRMDAGHVYLSGDVAVPVGRSYRDDFSARLDR
jgi:two-component system LytT family response regulator